jgi:hypothetical protein
MPAAIPYIAAILAEYLGSYVVAIVLIVGAGLYERDRARQQARDAYNRSLQDRIFPVRSGVAPRNYVMGTIRISGPILYIETVGVNRESLDVITAFANNECDILGWYFNDDFIAVADFPGTKYGGFTDIQSRVEQFAATGTTETVVLAAVPLSTHNAVKATWRQGTEAGTATIVSVVGTTVNVSALPVGAVELTITYTTAQSVALHAQFMHGTESQAATTWAPDYISPGWSSFHRLRGIAYGRTLFTWAENIYNQGAPAVSAVLTGRDIASHRFYDPRTGTNPVNTSNPAILAGWWMTLPRVKGGCGIDTTWVDWQSIAAAANICDEIVTLKNLQGAGYVTGPRYECNANLSTDDPPLKNLDIILSAMAGRRAFTAGLYKIVAGAYRPATQTITDADIAGKQSLTISMVAGDSAPPNIVTATFSDGNVNFVETAPKPIRNDAYVTADGHEETLDLVLPATTDGRRANYLMGVALEGSRPAMSVEVTVGGIGENLAVYDTVQFNVANRSVLSGRTFELVDVEDNWDGTFLTRWAEIRPQTWALDPDKFTPVTPVTPVDISYLWNPATVTNFAVAAITPQTLPDGTAVSQISLTWDALPAAGNTPAARIELRYRLAGGDWIGIASVPGDSTASTVTAALVDGEVYQFQARYVNGVGAASAWIDAWTNIAGTPLPAPLSLRLRASSTIFRVPQTGNAVPTVINLDVVRTTGLTNPVSFVTNPVGITLGGSGDNRTLAYAAMGANESMQVTITVTQGSIDYVDVVTILKVFDGVDSNTTPDSTPPPAPTGIVITSFIAHLLVTWDAPIYSQGHGHDSTIVFAAPAPIGSPGPTFAAAVTRGSSSGNSFAFPADPGTRWAIWLEHQSRDGYRSAPAGGTNGVIGTTATIGNSNLGPLIIQAGNLVDGAVTAPKIAAAALDATKFASSIQPIGIVSAVPGALTLRTVFNTTDGRLYKWNGTAYIATTPAADIAGQLSDSQIAAIAAAKLTGQITATQITDGSISTPKLAAGSVTTFNLAALSVTANALAANSVVAGKVAANSIDAGALQAGSVVAGKIAAAAVTATEIAAGAITASKIVVVGRGAALNDDPACVDAGAWGLYPTGLPHPSFAVNVPSSAAPGGTMLTMTGQTDVMSNQFPLIPGKRYRISGWARKVSGTGNAYLGLLFYTPGGFGFGYNSSFYIPGIAGQGIPATFTRYSAVFDTPPNITRAVVYTAANYGGNGDTNFADLRCEEVIPGELIVDGAITARKLTIVGGGGALTQDPDTVDITAWTYESETRFSIATITDTPGVTSVLRSTPGAGGVVPLSRNCTFDPAKTYRVRCRARSVGANGSFYLLVDLRDASDQRISGDGTFWLYPIGSTIPSSFTQYERRFGAGTDRPFPSNARTMAVGAILNYQGNAGYHEVTDILIEECVDGSLIVDGAITATKLAANSIVVGTAAIQNGAIVNAMIGNAAIDSAKILELQVEKLSSGTLGATINVGAGRIVFDNGTVMRVQGTGFGTTGQFIDWFGPRTAGGNINLCSESNAISYLKTNGQAYFGGSLIAGTLTNQAQSSDTGQNAFVEIGPFGTLGHSKTVNFGYSLDYVSTTGSSTNPGDPTVTVRLLRSIGGGAYTQLSSQNLTGSRQEVNQVGPGNFQHFMAAGGSWTFTDSNNSTQDFKYRAELIARNMPGGAISSIVQRISVGSVET